MRYEAELNLLRVAQPLTEPLETQFDFIKQAEEKTINFAKDYLEALAVKLRNEGLEVDVGVLRGASQKELSCLWIKTITI